MKMQNYLPKTLKKNKSNEYKLKTMTKQEKKNIDYLKNFLVKHTELHIKRKRNVITN